MLNAEEMATLQAQVRNLHVFVRQIIRDRACTCNKASHRCATNQMHEDMKFIMDSLVFPAGTCTCKDAIAKTKDRIIVALRALSGSNARRAEAIIKAMR